MVSVSSAFASPADGRLSVGDRTPEFSRIDLSGHRLTSRAWHGKLVLLNFWASWCGPCVEEMPRLSAWQTRYGPRGFQVIGVSMDDSEPAVRQWLARHPVVYPIAMGDAKLAEDFGGVFGLPLSYLIGTNGRILARFQGGGDQAAMQGKIEKLLARPARYAISGR